MCVNGVAFSSSEEQCKAVGSSYIQTYEITIESGSKDIPTRRGPHKQQDGMIAGRRKYTEAC